MIKLKYVIAILIFGMLIFIHELGHFIAAKCCGVRVLKFAIGMGPKIIGKTIGETEYSLRVFPIGGFCAMEGENTDAVTKSEIGEAAASTSERALTSKPRWQRFIILLAGPFMNIFLGFVLAVVLTCMLKAVPSNIIADFHKDETGAVSALSYDGGLREGDRIKKINGMTIFTPSDLSYQLYSKHTEGGSEVVVERDGSDVILRDVRFGDKLTGDYVDFHVKGLSKNPISVCVYSAKDTVSTARLIWISIVDIVTGKYGLKDMSGPVGVVSAMGDAVDQGVDLRESAMSLMSLTMFITVNLGIANLLPIPGLDGGQIMILGIEAIRRKPIKPEHAGIVNLVGLALVMLLIIVVTFSDVMKLIG